MAVVYGYIRSNGVILSTATPQIILYEPTPEEAEALAKTTEGLVFGRVAFGNVLARLATLRGLLPADSPVFAEPFTGDGWQLRQLDVVISAIRQEPRPQP